MKFKKFLSKFSNLSVNVSLVKTLLEMPRYAKFKKDLVINKRTMNFEIVEILQSCSIITLSNMVVKKKTLMHSLFLAPLGCINLEKLSVTYGQV